MASRIFQPAGRGFISGQSSCIGCEVTTAKSLGGSWIGDPAVAPLAVTGCHPVVSHGYAAQAGDTNDVICAAGSSGLQCHEASSAHIHFQKHPDKYEDSYCSAYDARSTPFASGGSGGRTIWGSSWRSSRGNSRWSA